MQSMKEMLFGGADDVERMNRKAPTPRRRRDPATEIRSWGAFGAKIKKDKLMSEFTKRPFIVNQTGKSIFVRFVRNFLVSVQFWSRVYGLVIVWLKLYKLGNFWLWILEIGAICGCFYLARLTIFGCSVLVKFVFSVPNLLIEH
jgi:hypothetical protein